jgi:glycosyltransferase involved in cell wall biosynthesis
MIDFDSAYTLKILRERNIATLVTGRDLGGYFDHIWTVHPVASLVDGEDPTRRYGPPDVVELAPRHTMIEGKIGRYAWLRRFAALNLALSLLSLYRVVAGIAREQHVDLIRAEDPTMNGILGWLLAKRFRLPLLVGVWGNPGAVRAQTGEPLMRRLFRAPEAEARVERFVLRRADVVMAQNEDNRKFCISQGAKPENAVIFRLGNLLYPPHFSQPSDRGDGLGKLAGLGIVGPFAIAVSRLEKLKLLDHVILAVASLKRRGYTITGVLVGDGAYRGELEALAEKLDVSEHIRIIGNRSQDWLVDVMPAATMVVSPLTGRALAEAALSGAPVVAYDIDWHSELIETDVTGELAPYLDHHGLADGMARILDNPVRAQRMGKALRARTLAMMDPATADATQIAVYRSLLNKRAM